ncbi:MAG TPA: urea carboxylase-associated family protein [Anaerolineae bacterium]|nr:urea carboxylase-associated family protein [Anaerolineae bacterium]
MASERTRIPAREGRSFDLRAGDRIKIISPFGHQVADFFAYCAADPSEYLSARHTVVSSTRHLYPRQGQMFLTSLRRPILKFVEDGAQERHEMLLAACDPARYRLLGVEGYHASCAENLQKAMAARGIAIIEIPQPLNLFSSTRADAEGCVVTHPNASEAGDYAMFEAFMDCIVVVSACPFDVETQFPVNVGGPHPIEVEIQRK